MSKYTLYTLIALLIPFPVSFFLSALIYRKRTIRVLWKALTAVLLSFVFISAISLCYLLPYAKAEEEAINALKSEDGLNYEKTDNYYAFTNKETDSALIFFPGARVDEKAYSVLAKKISESNIDVYVIKAPFHLALFCIDAPDKIISETDYEYIYISGHSLGGAIASIYTAKNSDKIDGVIMLGSYPSETINYKISLLSIYGDKDGLLQKDAYEKKKENWPADSQEYVIKGGNHSGFGLYGEQKGDNTAEITNEQQIETCAKQITEFINRN